nr:MAG TPA: hypothetical protein [Caudoviricetes sp.]
MQDNKKLGINAYVSLLFILFLFSLNKYNIVFLKKLK